MKKVVSTILVLSMLLSMSITANGAMTYDEIAQKAAEVCFDLGLIVGSGDGLTPEYLASPPKRYGGAKLIVGLRGYLDTALTYEFEENFNDYMDLSWTGGQNIMGYLKAHPEIGYNGKPGNLFDPNANMSVKEYYKLMLVSLGYKENQDFSWGGSDTMPDVMQMAKQSGLVMLDEEEPFTMAMMCIATYEALKANTSLGEMTLAAKLVEEGAIDEAISANHDLVEKLKDIPDVQAPSLSITTTYGTEPEVVTGQTSMMITLGKGTFVSDLGEDNANTNLLIEGIGGSLSTDGSFNNSVALTHEHIFGGTGATLRIDIPATMAYEIETDETITITIDPSLVEGVVLTPNQNMTGDISGTTTILAELPRTIMALGNVLNGTEPQVVAGEMTIELVLTNGSFIQSIGEDNDDTRALLSNIVGSLATETGFNQAVTLSSEHISRTAENAVVVTIPVSETYSVTEDETITITLTPSLFNELTEQNTLVEVVIANEDPAEPPLVEDSNPAVDDGAVDNPDPEEPADEPDPVGDLEPDDTPAPDEGEVDNTIPALDFDGSTVDSSAEDKISFKATAKNSTEEGVQSGTMVINLNVSGAKFTKTIGEDNNYTTALIEAIKGSGSSVISLTSKKGTAFNDVVALSAKHITRISDTQVSISIPKTSGYSIGADETITITLDPALFGDGNSKTALKPVGDALEDRVIIKNTPKVVVPELGSALADEIISLATVADLELIRENPSRDFVLTNDINLQGSSFEPITTFSGTLDGSGYKIYNYEIMAEHNVGFFVTLDGATLKDIEFADGLYSEKTEGSGYSFNVSEIGYIGVVASIATNGCTFTDVTVRDMTIEQYDKNVSGLVGKSDGSEFTNISVTEVLTGDWQQKHAYFGGITVNSLNDRMTGCDVTIDRYFMSDYIGGITANAYGSVIIDDCETNLFARMNRAGGGIVGLVTLDSVTVITNCKTLGYYEYEDYCGGIIGYNNGDLNAGQNYSGISTYTYDGFTGRFRDDAGICNRILGYNNGTMALYNTALHKAVHKAKEINISGTIISNDQWESDETGLDGKDSI